MTPHEEAAFEKKAERMLAGQREVPNGRNFLAWTMRYQNNEGYRNRFDGTFKRAPGSDVWVEQQFCPRCGRREAWCECK